MNIRKKLGIMQPYLFPYLGYFQLMDAVDEYYFCGSLQYTKRTWVNRNRICINAKKNDISYFTFSIAKDDISKRINERYYSNLKNDKEKLKRYIYQTYKSAKNFEEAYCVLEKALSYENENVAYFNMNSNYVIAEYLGVSNKINAIEIISDEDFWINFYQLDYQERVIYLCKYLNCDTYINAIGGTELYHRETFQENDIDLRFIQMSENVVYPQWKNEFIPSLSIIDVIMHNDKSEMGRLLKQYEII